MGMKDIKSMYLSEIINDFNELSQKPYRASQVYSWIVKGAQSFDEMTNIPKDLRETLKTLYFIPQITIKNKLVSTDGTMKYLFELPDKELIESVLMKYHHGFSICVSTQVGCKMNCSFCSTGKSGFSRNLSPSEMIMQIEAAQEDCGIKVSNVVLMGMGEPLDNYDNVVKFIKLISSSDHMNIGARHISLSTCGIVDKIYKLSEEKIPATLSISLHAPNDEIRNQIMKINKRWNIEELIAACKHYISLTGRRISFEYAMIENVNDTQKCAHELAALLQRMLCHVNLIPLNEFENNESLKKSSKNKIYAFKDILEKEGITATIRRTLGQDIEAACGQLKRKHMQGEVNLRGGILQ